MLGEFGVFSCDPVSAVGELAIDRRQLLLASTPLSARYRLSRRRRGLGSQDTWRMRLTTVIRQCLLADAAADRRKSRLAGRWHTLVGTAHVRRR